MDIIPFEVGAFAEWRVVFYALTRSRVEPMMRIVKAGGGEAVLREDVQREDIEVSEGGEGKGRRDSLQTLLPTHVLVDGTMTDPTWMWNLEVLPPLPSLLYLHPSSPSGTSFHSFSGCSCLPHRFPLQISHDGSNK